ncbi:MAG: LuxR C-terminal-related transcriptional regulator [Lysobacterales bacterium]|nr:hypothetical protein [Rhodanobacteraceae bacterium]
MGYAQADHSRDFSCLLQRLLASECGEPVRAVLIESARERGVAGVAMFSHEEAGALEDTLRFHWAEDLSGALGDVPLLAFAEEVARRSPRRLFNWVMVRDKPFWLGQVARYVPFSRTLALHATARPGMPRLQDLVVVPYRHQGHCHALFFGFHRAPDARVVEELNTIALAYVAKWLTELVTGRQQTQAARGTRLNLNERQLECLRWVVAGKSLHEVAAITEMSYANVRYHLEKAKQESGFGSLQQLTVQAALEYDLSPLGPRHQA